MTTHIKHLLSAFMKEKKEKGVEIEKLRSIAEGVIDPHLKKQIWLKKVSGSCLIFASSSAAFGYELNLKKKKILKAVQAEFPYIEKIKIKIEAR